MKISYYELLGMIKDGNIPEKVIDRGDTYFWNGKRYKSEIGIYLSDFDEIEMFVSNYIDGKLTGYTLSNED